MACFYLFLCYKRPNEYHHSLMRRIHRQDVCPGMDDLFYFDYDGAVDADTKTVSGVATSDALLMGGGDDRVNDKDEDEVDNSDATDRHSIRHPFPYEADQFRVFDPVILPDDEKRDDASARGRTVPSHTSYVDHVEYADSDDTDTTTRSCYAIVHGTEIDSDALSLDVENANDLLFSTRCPSFQPVFTRVKDAAAAVERGLASVLGRVGAARMHAASLFHTEKAVALATLLLTSRAMKRAFGVPMSLSHTPITNKRLVLHATADRVANAMIRRIPSAFTFEQWMGSRFTTHYACHCPESDIVRVHMRHAQLPPWLLFVDLTNTNARHSREWLQALQHTSWYPVLSSTASSVVDARYSGDMGWWPPSVWLRASFSPSMSSSSDTAYRIVSDLSCAILPTVADFSASTINEQVCKWVERKAHVRRLRCIRVRLAPAEHSLRHDGALRCLFRVMKELPPTCKRIEIFRADFTYSQQHQLWEKECPPLPSASVELIEPIAATNTLIQMLGTTKFGRLSIWKPLTSQALHSQIHEF